MFRKIILLAHPVGSVVCAGSVVAARARVVVDGGSAVFLGEKVFFDFPDVGFCADAELEIFLGDGVPVLFAVG